MGQGRRYRDGESQRNGRRTWLKALSWGTPVAAVMTAVAVAAGLLVAAPVARANTGGKPSELPALESAEQKKRPPEDLAGDFRHQPPIAGEADDGKKDW